jgi:hypothetical protein
MRRAARLFLSTFFLPRATESYQELEMYGVFRSIWCAKRAYIPCFCPCPTSAFLGSFFSNTLPKFSYLRERYRELLELSIFEAKLPSALEILSTIFLPGPHQGPLETKNYSSIKAASRGRFLWHGYAQ